MGNGNEDKEKGKREPLTPELKLSIISWVSAIVGIPTVIVLLSGLYFIFWILPGQANEEAVKQLREAARADIQKEIADRKAEVEKEIEYLQSRLTQLTEEVFMKIGSTKDDHVGRSLVAIELGCPHASRLGKSGALSNLSLLPGGYCEILSSSPALHHLAPHTRPHGQGG